MGGQGMRKRGNRGPKATGRLRLQTAFGGHARAFGFRGWKVGSSRFSRFFCRLQCLPRQLPECLSQLLGAVDHNAPANAQQHGGNHLQPVAPAAHAGSAVLLLERHSPRRKALPRLALRPSRSTRRFGTRTERTACWHASAAAHQIRRAGGNSPRPTQGSTRDPGGTCAERVA